MAMSEEMRQKHSEIPEGVLDAYDALFERATDLDPEKRNLFIEHVLLKVKTMIGAAMSTTDPLRSKMLLGLAENSLNLVGMVNAANSDDAGWTSTGDKAVCTLWDDWLHMMTSHLGGGVIPIHIDDVPPDTLKRLKEGKPTSEDLELVREAMRATGVEVPDGVEVEFGGVFTDKDDAEKVEAKSEEKGYGLYL